MFEQASRVPLIISWPQRWSGGQRHAGASSHLDLVQTLAAVGGAHIPHDWNGESMLSWLDNSRHAWKNYAVSEYYAHNTASGYVMSRDGEWKYTYHTIIGENHPVQRELYNLRSDPQEFTNLANRPEHRARIDAMHKRIVKEVGRDPDERNSVRGTNWRAAMCAPIQSRPQLGHLNKSGRK